MRANVWMAAGARRAVALAHVGPAAAPCREKVAWAQASHWYANSRLRFAGGLVDLVQQFAVAEDATGDQVGHGLEDDDGPFEASGRSDGGRGSPRWRPCR
jgi:hypothetical protein